MTEQEYGYQVFGLVPFVEDEKVIISTGGVSYSDGKSYNLTKSMTFEFQDVSTVIVIARNDRNQTIEIHQIGGIIGKYENVKFVKWDNGAHDIVIARTNPR